MTSTAVEVQGTCDPRFERVREVFAQQFADGLELGSSVAVTLDGASVVDLWAGWADGARTRAWERDTIVNVFSSTKGMTALCAHMLVDRGRLDLDAPVARYWPEFAQAGKARIPVRYLLSHRAGLPAIAEPLPPEAEYDWARMVGALERQSPWWEPGTTHGYHSRTYGWLVGEVVRRIDGRSIGTFFREEVAKPLGVDFHIGLAAKHDGRVAEMPNDGVGGPRPAADVPEYAVLAFRNPRRPKGSVNTREWRAAELPAGGGHGNARALARVYGALACGGTLDGVRLLSPEAIARATVEQSNGRDAVVGVHLRFGLGFILPQPQFGDPWSERAFGHAGAGGSLGYADPARRLGFGYTMNLIGGADDMRSKRLAQAACAAADAAR